MTSIRSKPAHVPSRTVAGVGVFGQVAVVGLILLAALVAGSGFVIRAWYLAEGRDAAAGQGGWQDDVESGGVPRAAQQPAVPDSLLSPGPGDAAVPQTGPGTVTYGVRDGRVAGSAGTVRRYQVAVEDGIGQEVEAFGVEAEAVLGDARSWIAGGDLRLQLVSKASSADFTIILATPATSERMCADAGLRTRRYTSCRVSDKVIINLARWLTATPSYGAPVVTYRAYAINHEVGHALGHGHEDCAKKGKPAPVMLQQTLGLRGCVANPWPYLDGRRYAGPSIA